MSVNTRRLFYWRRIKRRIYSRFSLYSCYRIVHSAVNTSTTNPTLETELKPKIKKKRQKVFVVFYLSSISCLNTTCKVMERAVRAIFLFCSLQLFIIMISFLKRRKEEEEKRNRIDILQHVYRGKVVTLCLLLRSRQTHPRTQFGSAVCNKQ